ncbi:MAG: N-acyl homoserine lactonase family protein [Actinomycetota bacterium]
MHEVFAVRYGTLATTRGREFHSRAYGDRADEPLEMAYYFWVVMSPSEVVLIDTGFAPAVGTARGRTLVADPVESLGALGISPNDVDKVLVTHFHYDHVGNLARFPRARFFCSRDEYRFWSSALARRPVHRAAVEDSELAYLEDLRAEGRLLLLDRDMPLAQGMQPVWLPGHTAGQLGVVLETAGSRVLVASDAVHFYDEFEGDEVFRIFDDLNAFLTSVDRIRTFEALDLVVVPGHDPRVAERAGRPAHPDAPQIIRLGQPEAADPTTASELSEDHRTSC